MHVHLEAAGTTLYMGGGVWGMHVHLEAAGTTLRVSEMTAGVGHAVLQSQGPVTLSTSLRGRSVMLSSMPTYA